MLLIRVFLFRTDYFTQPIGTNDTFLASFLIITAFHFVHNLLKDHIICMLMQNLNQF